MIFMAATLIPLISGIKAPAAVWDGFRGDEGRNLRLFFLTKESDFHTHQTCMRGLTLVINVWLDPEWNPQKWKQDTPWWALPASGWTPMTLMCLTCVHLSPGGLKVPSCPPVPDRRLWKHHVLLLASWRFNAAGLVLSAPPAFCLFGIDFCE